MLSFYNVPKQWHQRIYIVRAIKPHQSECSFCVRIGRKMTIHSISIEPCSLSISKRRINWPLLLPPFHSMIAVLFMFVQLSYRKYKTMLASVPLDMCSFGYIRIQFSKAIVIILFVCAYNLCRWQNFIGRETISLQAVANCPRTKRKENTQENSANEYNLKIVACDTPTCLSKMLPMGEQNNSRKFNTHQMGKTQYKQPLHISKIERNLNK